MSKGISLAIGGVALALFLGTLVYQGMKGGDSAPGQETKIADVLNLKQTPVKGLIGSEKDVMFKSAEFISAADDFAIDTSKMGSREVYNQTTLAGYDFVFISGEVVNDFVKKHKTAGTPEVIFTTPMVIASWQKIVQSLGIAVSKDAQGINYIDTQKLFEIIDAKKKWNELPNTQFPERKPILVNTSNILKSNSALQFFSLGAYVYNGFEVVQNTEEVEKYYTSLSNLFLRQGMQDSSSDGPFNDYTTMGMGKAPMVFTYESQIANYLAQYKDAEKVILYPKPTINTKHYLIPLTPAGEKFKQFLLNDQKVREVYVKYGFRAVNAKNFAEAFKAQGVVVPASINDVANPPNMSVINYFLTKFEVQSTQ